MFDAVRNNQRIVQVFLGLIILPFAFWGIDSYFRSGGGGSDLASVGDTKINAQQFEQALREQQDQLRQRMGDTFRPEMMNNPEVRLGILNNLIDQRLLLLEASKARLATSDAALRNYIGNASALQENGKFSMALYENMLRGQGMSQAQFEAKVRQDLTMQQLIGSVNASAFVSETQADALLRIQSEERQFGEFKIAGSQYAGKVKIDPAAVQKYYDDNKANFAIPEQIKAEYVVLSIEALMPQMVVTDAEVKSWYDEHLRNYQVPEERRASHILISFDDEGADQEKAKAAAKAKAEEVLKEVQKTPNKFADLAKQYSKDPGSAQNGGDLGYFTTDAMVKPFADAAFLLKENEISDLVETEFGYHIIKVTGIKKAKQRSLEEVHAEIEGELKRRAATRKFAEEAEAFNNTVYEQSDSLQPAAEKFHLKIQQSNWLPKTTDPQVIATLGPFANERVMQALFSEDATKNKRNTEATEIAPSTLLAARVLEHTPASTKPFDTVKADIEKLLKQQEIQVQAKAAGQALLDGLNKGEDKTAWANSRSTSRIQAARLQLPPKALQAIFKANVQKLPAYVGVESGDDYMLYKITKVTQPEKVDEGQVKAVRAEFGRIVGQEDFAAYLASLRSRYKVDINKALLEGKDRQ